MMRQPALLPSNKHWLNGEKEEKVAMAQMSSTPTDKNNMYPLKVSFRIIQSSLYRRSHMHAYTHIHIVIYCG